MICHTKLLSLLKISWVENNLLSMLSPRIYLHRQLIRILRQCKQPRNLAFTCFQIYLNQNKTHLGSIWPGQELTSWNWTCFLRYMNAKGQDQGFSFWPGLRNHPSWGSFQLCEHSHYGSVQRQNGRAGNGLQVWQAGSVLHAIYSWETEFSRSPSTSIYWLLIEAQ